MNNLIDPPAQPNNPDLLGVWAPYLHETPKGVKQSSRINYRIIFKLEIWYRLRAAFREADPNLRVSSLPQLCTDLLVLAKFLYIGSMV